MAATGPDCQGGWQEIYVFLVRKKRSKTVCCQGVGAEGRSLKSLLTPIRSLLEQGW